MKKKIRLLEIAHARSGDKGNHANIGVIARRASDYEVLKREVTAERVKAHFKNICQGEVLRYELPNLQALNFVLKESLDGGGTVSLRSDAQGKTFGASILRLEIEIDT